MSFRKLIILIGFVLMVQVLFAQSSKHRAIFLADMGHDPDDEQQMVHMMVCSNEFDVEGLILVTGRVFNPRKTIKIKDLRPQLFHLIIDAYEKVYPNLQKHAQGYKTPDYFRSIVASGQTGNGVADTGKGKTTAGSQLIVNAVCKNDPRPVHIIINGGANTLAQALIDYQTEHTAKEMDVFVSKLCVFDNTGQDDAGAWICHNYPNIHWVRSIYQNQCFAGPSNENLGPHVWKPYEYSPEGQHEWTKENIQTNHGASGAYYPDRFVYTMHFIGGGGTVPWLSFTTGGLTDPTEPSYGGFSGRYSVEKQLNAPSGQALVIKDEEAFYPYKAYTDNELMKDKWTAKDGTEYNSVYAGVWRWRDAIWNDLKARMDWCVVTYEQANHHPKVMVNGDQSNHVLKISAKPGQQVQLSALGSSDPDKDKLIYHWWFYKEAGLKPYDKDIIIENDTSQIININVPEDAKGKDLHIILEVWDDSKKVALASFKRTIIEVN